MCVKERLKEFLQSKNISERGFAKAINVSSGYVNAISKSIQPEKIRRISMHFPELNIVWLLTGEGNMLKGGDEKPNDARVSELERLLAERDKQVSELQNEVRLLLEAKEKDRLLLQAKDEIIALLKKQNAATERGKVGREGKVYA
jgi:transcriptional regulator with XRE-family HTH domain